MSVEKSVQERLAELEKEIEAIKWGYPLKDGSINLHHLDSFVHERLLPASD